LLFAIGLVMLAGVVRAWRKGEYIGRLYYVRRSSRPAKFNFDLGMEAVVWLIAMGVAVMMFFVG